MLMLGLRRSEICGLRWDNVDLDGRTLSVTQSVQRVEGKLTELPTKPALQSWQGFAPLVDARDFRVQA